MNIHKKGMGHEKIIELNGHCGSFYQIKTRQNDRKSLWEAKPHVPATPPLPTFFFFWGGGGSSLHIFKLVILELILYMLWCGCRASNKTKYAPHRLNSVKRIVIMR